MATSVYDLTLADIRNRVLAMLGESSTDSYFGTYVDAWINDGIAEMGLEGEAVEGTYTWQTAAGVRDYAFPPTLTIIKIKLLTYDGRRLDRRPIKQQDYFSSASGVPAFYGLFGKAILLGPSPPSEVKDLKAYLIREPFQLNADGDKPDMPPRFRHYLVDYAYAQARLADGRPDVAGPHLQKFNAGAQRYQSWALGSGRDNFRTVSVEHNYE